MDISMFLEPVSEKCFEKAQRPGKKTFGETIVSYCNEKFLSLENVQIALLGIKDEIVIVPVAINPISSPITEKIKSVVLG